MLANSVNFFDNRCLFCLTYRLLYGRHKHPSEQVFQIKIARFHTIHTLVSDNMHPQRRRTMYTGEVVNALVCSVRRTRMNQFHVYSN